MRKYKFSIKKFNLQFSIELLQKIFLAGFILLALCLGYYQIIKGEYYSQRAKNNYIRVIPQLAMRGSILDRNGRILSYDRAIFNISVIPYQIRDKSDALFKDLSKFLNCDLELIYKNYNRNKGFKSLFSPVDIITDIDKKEALKLKEKFGNSILINPQPQRFYPYSAQFAHLVGYVQKATSLYEKLKKYGYSPLERVGLSGIEQQYDAYLKGEDGGDLIEVNAQGKIVGFLGKRMPKKGKDVQLSVDSRIQKEAGNALSGRRGTIILMDSNSGEIIALYSSPSFDPNYFVEGKNINKYLKNKNSPLLNRAIQAVYPLGSTFKPLLAVAALEAEKIKPEKTFMCSGALAKGNTQFRCSSTHYEEDLYQAITHSCNVYFYNVGLISGPNTIAKWAKKFGLDSLTGVDLPHEKKGFVPDPKWKQKVLKQNWFAGDTLNMSIGQGYLESTPLEVTVAINAIANGGYLVRPQILKKVGNIPSDGPSLTPLGICDKNLNVIKKALRDVVSRDDGTAKILKNLNLQIAGKTGTAQTKGRAHGWFVGFFPYKNPKYTVCIFLEKGGSSHQALKVLYNFLAQIKKKGLL